MKLFDVNASVGHWPFRALPWRTVDDLLRLMDGAGIEWACACNLHGLFYKDAHQANVELARDAEVHRDRIVLAATLNPGYVGWRDDLRRCVDDLGVAAVRLFPLYHGYEMHRDAGLELLHAATELRLPLQVPLRVVDPRQGHRLDVDREVGLAEVLSAVRAHPEGTYMVLEARGGPPAGALPSGQGGAVYFDLSRQPIVFRNQGAQLLENVGPERLVFGSGMLLKPPEPALIRLAQLPVEGEQREDISWRTARALFGRDGA